MKAKLRLQLNQAESCFTETAARVNQALSSFPFVRRLQDRRGQSNLKLLVDDLYLTNDAH